MTLYSSALAVVQTIASLVVLAGTHIVDSMTILPLPLNQHHLARLIGQLQCVLDQLTTVSLVATGSIIGSMIIQVQGHRNHHLDRDGFPQSPIGL
jgi:F0F1-type ATP synthase delta subunit